MRNPAFGRKKSFLFPAREKRKPEFGTVLHDKVSRMGVMVEGPS